MDANQAHGRADYVWRSGELVVHLLDSPYLTAGTQRKEVPDGSKRLLAFVAIRRRRVQRSQAAGTLWPLGTQERSSGNLRTALWRLRQAGIDVVTADKWELALRGDVWVDLHIMDQWAARLIEGTANEHDLRVPPACADALDLLPGWYDEWVLMERERLRQRMLHALEALSGQLVRVKRFGDAVEAAMLAISAEPLRESAQRALIEAHIAEGNLADAYRRYRVYAELTRRELGIAPSGELSALLRLPASRRLVGTRVLP